MPFAAELPPRRTLLSLATALGWLFAANAALAQAPINPTAAPNPNIDVQPPVPIESPEAGATNPASPNEDLHKGPHPPNTNEPGVRTVNAPRPPPTPPPESTPTASSEKNKDQLDNAGYVPGYRRTLSLGLSPFAPGVDTLPGGMTPAFGAPSPEEDWSFRFSGYMSATLQAGLYDRRYTHPGQSTTVFHVPPRTLDEWASFTSTYPVQGSWVSLRFAYGSEYITANATIDTWNPTEPTTYYQLGSQYFINNAYLAIRAPTLAGIRLHWNVGYFGTAYGNLGRYGAGMYVNPLEGTLLAAGETTNAEFDLSDNLILTFEHGIGGPRVGRPPIDVVPNGANASANPNSVATWTHHAHLGIVKKGDLTLEAMVHYMRTWAQDDTAQRNTDIPPTNAIDETYIRDGHINIYGFDARAISNTWGYLAGGVSYLEGKNAFPLKGLLTYAGDGERLTNAWWGTQTGGTGKLLVAALNYSASIGRIVTSPDPFPSNHADLTVDASVHIAKSWTAYEPFNRTRHKYGVNLLYTFLPFMGAGVRVDRVVPNSLDSRETYHVIAPRLQFKTDWNSRETITLTYVKWFLGSRTRGDNNVTPYQLDDQLVALNFNFYW